MHYHYPSKLVMNNAKNNNALSLLMHYFKKKFKWHFYKKFR